MRDLKILLWGPCGSGKTKFLQLASGKNNHSRYYYLPTIGTDLIMIKNNDTDFLFWDCSGNRRYEFMIKQYINSSNAVVYFTDEVFDSNLINILSENTLPKFVICTKATPNPLLFFGWNVINGVNKTETQIMCELLSYFKQDDDFVDLDIKNFSKKSKKWFNKLRCLKRVDSYSSFRQLQ
jgi:hypothetical protein